MSGPVTTNETTVLSLLANRWPLSTRWIAQNALSAAFSLTATGAVVAAVPGSRIVVYAVKLVVSAALTINFRDGTGGSALEGAMAYAANGGAVEFVTPPMYLFRTTIGNELDLVISGAGTAAGRISYWLDDGTVLA